MHASGCPDIGTAARLFGQKFCELHQVSKHTTSGLKNCQGLFFNRISFFAKAFYFYATSDMLDIPKLKILYYT